MKVSFILSNKTQDFYEKIASMPPNAQYMYLKKVMGITPKIGDNNTMAECIEFNMQFKMAGESFKESVMNIRKGYRVLILTI